MLNSRFIFIIAFIAVLIGVYGLADRLFLSHEPEKKSPINYILWQVKTTIPKGTLLTWSDLKRVKVGEKEARVLGINSNVDLKLDSQTLTNTTLNTDQYLFPEQLSHPGDPDYMMLITKGGMALYTLTVATKKMVKHYILPGDYVDIFVISSPKYNLLTDPKQLRHLEGLRASLLVKQVRVLSTSEFADVDPKEKVSSKEEIQIVIEVPPDALARLILAQHTTLLEVHPSQNYSSTPDAYLSDIITNYSGVVELRGENETNVGAGF